MIAYTENFLAHHGTKGQKWGIRRFQNEDGTLTEAGKRRYGVNRDINDRSLTNIAKIRTGEAKRRLDVAKANYDGTNHTRIADLQARVRSAKKNEHDAKKIEAGAKLASKGQTITRNQAKQGAVLLGSIAVSNLLELYMNKRLKDLGSQGRRTPEHDCVAAILASAPFMIGVGYSAAAEIRNSKLRAYNTAKLTGASTKKSVGSTEYQDVLKRRKGES